MSAEPREPLIIRAADREGQATAAGGDIYATLATGADTDGGYFLTHSIVPAGGGDRPRTSIPAKKRPST